MSEGTFVTFSYPEPITSLAFSPDGTCITGAQGGHFKIHKIEGNELLHTEHGLPGDRVVSQNWSVDGLNTVFKSGWVVTTRLEGELTNARYHQITTKSVDLASVDPTGLHKAIAQGGDLSIWSRALGQERWTFKEMFTVPVDMLKSEPLAKSIFWSDYSDQRITVIYRKHGIITWLLGKHAKIPFAINRPETSEIVQAQVGPGGKKTALVFKDGPEFRIYHHPACTLAETFPTNHPPGPMIFTHQGTRLIGAVRDTLFIYNLDPGAKRVNPIVLSHEDIPITSVAQNSKHRPWLQRSHHYIAIAQGSTVIIWTTPEERKVHAMTCLKSGILLGLVIEIFVLFFFREGKQHMVQDNQESRANPVANPGDGPRWPTGEIESTKLDVVKLSSWRRGTVLVLSNDCGMTDIRQQECCRTRREHSGGRSLPLTRMRTLQSDSNRLSWASAPQRNYRSWSNAMHPYLTGGTKSLTRGGYQFGREMIERQHACILQRMMFLYQQSWHSTILKKRWDIRLQAASSTRRPNGNGAGGSRSSATGYPAPKDGRQTQRTDEGNGEVKALGTRERPIPSQSPILGCRNWRIELPENWSASEKRIDSDQVLEQHDPPTRRLFSKVPRSPGNGFLFDSHCRAGVKQRVKSNLVQRHTYAGFQRSVHHPCLFLGACARVKDRRHQDRRRSVGTVQFNKSYMRTSSLEGQRSAHSRASEIALLDRIVCLSELLFDSQLPVTALQFP
ncbi:hypothetical protein C8R43DRAFT_955263 [Mycena crocata]|nr:hypothetical protein C8R43DRAFT_955263 [Mycena crocata]